MFQSTHSRRVRLQRLALRRFGTCFNPRTHAECDVDPGDAPFKDGCFNPRTHAECDCFSFKYGVNGWWFQSTHSRRVRQSNSDVTSGVLLFQSTHSRRVRHQMHYHRTAVPRVSIHALTQSATHQSRSDEQDYTVSIHALTQSATKASGCEKYNTDVSIHALTQSATTAIKRY